MSVIKLPYGLSACEVSTTVVGASVGFALGVWAVAKPFQNYLSDYSASERHAYNALFAAGLASLPITATASVFHAIFCITLAAYSRFSPVRTERIEGDRANQCHQRHQLENMDPIYGCLAGIGIVSSIVAALPMLYFLTKVIYEAMSGGGSDVSNADQAAVMMPLASPSPSPEPYSADGPIIPMLIMPLISGVLGTILTGLAWWAAHAIAISPGMGASMAATFFIKSAGEAEPSSTRLLSEDSSAISVRTSSPVADTIVGAAGGRANTAPLEVGQC